MNESVWRGQRPPPGVAALGDALGTRLSTHDEWVALWDGSGLQDRRTELFPIDLGAETRSRVQWVGWRWLLPAWGRAARLIATDRGARQALRTQASFPPSLAGQMGYVLSVGRVG